MRKKGEIKEWANKQISVRMVRMNEKGQIITSEGKTDLTKQN